MFDSHIVRVGALGQVLSLVSPDCICYPRGARVVVRTQRGLEVGEVLSPPVAWEDAAFTAPDGARRADADGEILRRMTVEDELLLQRLTKNRLAAHQACQERLESLGLPALLVDTEFLFDGQTLIFYFLGEVPAGLEGVLNDLAEAYDARAGVRAFTQTLLAGCGPDCGTKQGCSDACGGCETRCALAGVRRLPRGTTVI